MPQTISAYNYEAPVPIVRPDFKFYSNLDDAVEHLMEHGFVCLDQGSILPSSSWKDVESLMNRLDEKTILDINSCYNEKKIIKTNQTGADNVDRKIAFDLCQQRFSAMKEGGVMDRLPELAGMDMVFRFGKEAFRCFGEKMSMPLLGSADYNVRMIDYKPGSGTCLPHRDFGLFSLIQQNGVSGLQVEYMGDMVSVPGDCDVVLAGWCLHLLTNGETPAPLHQVVAPTARRLTNVAFIAPAKDTVLCPMFDTAPDERRYKDVTAGELKMMMARRWRVREGTVAGAEEDSISQDDVVFNMLRI